MPTFSDTSINEEDNDIIAEYENKDDDDGQGSFKGEDEGSGNDEEGSTKRRIDPATSRKTTSRNPIPTLNTQRLKGPKGIHTIEKYFEGFKFHGKGHEKTDLDRVMKRMEHWAHRLFPKLDFDDFLEKVEKLGTKKDLQVFVRKYQQDMIDDDAGLVARDNADDDEEKEETEPIDEFDILIAEQIEKQKQVAIQHDLTSAEDKFNQLLASSGNANSQPLKDKTDASSKLTDEVKARIERNKQKAIQIRLARLQALKEEAQKKKLEEIESAKPMEEECLPSTSGEQLLNKSQNFDNLEGAS